jgi:hypothetical protein
MLRNRILSAVLGVLSLGVFTASTSAQVQRIPNTGCPNAPYMTFTGAPAIGMGFGLIAGPCRTANGIPFLVIGVPGVNAVLPVPPGCERGCVLECRPIVVLMQSAWRTTIPNDRNLIGAGLCAQSGCVEDLRPPCIYLHGALGIRITP